MSVRIFKNKEDQDQFDKQGFLCMAFLSTDEIQELNVFFDEMHPDLNENGFFSGSYSSDFDYKKKASDKIVEVFSRAYSETFTNYTPFGGAFLYKTPGEQSELAAHQDWTIVDEDKAIALNCWVPLCDVDISNDLKPAACRLLRRCLHPKGFRLGQRLPIPPRNHIRNQHLFLVRTHPL